MEVRETITLSRLSAPPETYLPILSAWPFTVSGSSLHLEGVYEPGRLAAVARLLEQHALRAQAHHSVYPIFSDEEYRAADLVELFFPDHWVDELESAAPCPECGRQIVKIDTGFRVSKVRSRHAVLSVNGEFTVVGRKVKDGLQRGDLEGCRFEPFSEDEAFFYLLARSGLGDPIIRPDESLGYAGPCSTCGRPRFRVHFGPLRFPRAAWTGDDFAWCDFTSSLLYSPRAVTAIQKYQPDAERGDPVFLE